MRGEGGAVAPGMPAGRGLMGGREDALPETKTRAGEAQKGVIGPKTTSKSLRAGPADQPQLRADAEGLGDSAQSRGPTAKAVARWSLAKG